MKKAPAPKRPRMPKPKPKRTGTPSPAVERNQASTDEFEREGMGVAPKE